MQQASPGCASLTAASQNSHKVPGERWTSPSRPPKRSCDPRLGSIRQHPACTTAWKPAAAPVLQLRIPEDTLAASTPPAAATPAPPGSCASSTASSTAPVQRKSQTSFLLQQLPRCPRLRRAEPRHRLRRPRDAGSAIQPASACATCPCAPPAAQRSRARTTSGRCPRPRPAPSAAAQHDRNKTAPPG